MKTLVFALAAVLAVAEPAPDGTIYVVHRCFANSCGGWSEAPILKYRRARRAGQGSSGLQVQIYSISRPIFDQEGAYIDEWRQFGRPSGIFITADDTIYMTDSESGPDTGARELPGIRKGARTGSARDGTVTAFIEDIESTVPDHSGAEGVGVDASGNVYGAVVRPQMLERHMK